MEELRPTSEQIERMEAYAEWAERSARSRRILGVHSHDQR